MSAVENRSSINVSHHQLDRSVYSAEAPQQKSRINESISRKASEEVLKRDSKELLPAPKPVPPESQRKPPVPIPRLDLRDAQVQTSLDLTAGANIKLQERAKSQPPIPQENIQAPEKMSKDIVIDTEQVSPEQLVDRQLRELEEQQKQQEEIYLLKAQRAM